MLLLYNTLTRRKEKFKPITEGMVGMYACGPTVYYFAHIGNMRTYLNEDVIRRVLSHKGYQVEHIMNITDVGHLIGDGEIGEDKIAASAKAEHKSAADIANFYTQKFIEDSRHLNILEPTKTPKATEHILEMITLAEKLEQNGFLYRTELGMYFDTSKFKDYGKMSGMSFKKLEEGLKAGARVERVEGIKHPSDFAVWRFASPEQKEMVWDTKWGKGFPGWHIECSAMSMKYLGEHFDLHFGGIDHIQVHHPNEIAQSEGATGHKFVNYWMHMNFMTVDGKKMSKSLKNIYTLSELIERGHSAMAVRYFLISAHYRQELNFTFEALTNTEKTLGGIYYFLDKISNISNTAPNTDAPEFKKKVAIIKREFFKQLEDDINMPSALAQMHGLINEANLRIESGKMNKLEARGIARLMLEMDRVLGLDFAEHVKKRKPLAKEVEKLVEEREAARRAKDFAKSDQIRGLLKSRYHITLEDTKDGVKWYEEKS